MANWRQQMDLLDPEGEAWEWVNNALTPFYYTALVAYVAVIALGVLGALAVLGVY